LAKPFSRVLRLGAQALASNHPPERLSQNFGYRPDMKIEKFQEFFKILATFSNLL